jgi:hypothetical protein
MGKLIGNCDQCLFDMVAQEVNQLAGTTGIVFQFEPLSSIRDPLYDEEIDTVYKKNAEGTEGIEIPMFFRSPDRTPITGEEGFRLDRVSELWIAAKDLTNAGLRLPRVGDIIKVWNMYYDVTDYSRSEGYLNDTPDAYSVVKVDVVRRTKAPPEGLWVRD